MYIILYLIFMVLFLIIPFIIYNLNNWNHKFRKKSSIWTYVLSIQFQNLYYHFPHHLFKLDDYFQILILKLPTLIPIIFYSKQIINITNIKLILLTLTYGTRNDVWLMWENRYWLLIQFNLNLFITLTINAMRCLIHFRCLFIYDYEDIRVDTNLVKVIHSTRIPSPRHPILSNRLKDHTLFNALFETTVLTPVPLGLRDFATTLCHARVHSPILHSPFEETLTPAHTLHTFVRRFYFPRISRSAWKVRSIFEYISNQ